MEWNYCRWTPFCSSFTDKHSGENIAHVVDVDLDDKLDIAANLPKWGVSDNASNMVKAINMSIVQLYTCNCHTQQLAISNAMKSFKDSGDEETMEGSCENLPTPLPPCQNCVCCACSFLQIRTCLFSGRKHCDSQEGLAGPWKSGRSCNCQNQSDLAEGVWLQHLA